MKPSPERGQEEQLQRGEAAFAESRFTRGRRKEGPKNLGWAVVDAGAESTVWAVRDVAWTHIANECTGLLLCVPAIIGRLGTIVRCDRSENKTTVLEPSEESGWPLLGLGWTWEIRRWAATPLGIAVWLA
jgi:hypothetical protein